MSKNAKTFRQGVYSFRVYSEDKDGEVYVDYVMKFMPDMKEVEKMIENLKKKEEQYKRVNIKIEYKIVHQDFYGWF